MLFPLLFHCVGCSFIQSFQQYNKYTDLNLMPRITFDIYDVSRWTIRSVSYTMFSLRSFTGKRKAVFQLLIFQTDRAFCRLFSVLFVNSWLCYTMLFLNRENLFEEMLQEPDEVSMKRKRTRETLRVLQQAFRVGLLNFIIHRVSWITLYMHLSTWL